MRVLAVQGVMRMSLKPTATFDSGQEDIRVEKTMGGLGERLPMVRQLDSLMCRPFQSVAFLPQPASRNLRKRFDRHFHSGGGA